MTGTLTMTMTVTPSITGTATFTPVSMTASISASSQCGNMVVDNAWERCDFGPNPAMNTCCTPSCNYDKPGKRCGPRQGGICFTKRRCNAVGTCRPSIPERKYKVCGKAKICDGKGACIIKPPRI